MATFTIFNPSEDIVYSTDTVFTSAWSNNTNTLTAASSFTSSEQAITTSPSSSGNFYIEVYDKTDPDNDSSAEVQYAVAYGHKGRQWF